MDTKKVITYVVVAFVIFYLFTQPAAAAGAIKGVMNGITTGAEQLSKFVNSLVAG
jgi:hypothetical protein